MKHGAIKCDGKKFMKICEYLQDQTVQAYYKIRTHCLNGFTFKWLTWNSLKLHLKFSVRVSFLVLWQGNISFMIMQLSIFWKNCGVREEQRFCATSCLSADLWLQSLAFLDRATYLFLIAFGLCVLRSLYPLQCIHTQTSLW